MPIPSPHPDLSERIDFFKSISLFAGLNEADLAAVAGDFRERTYRRGDIIFHQGDYSRVLYVVRRGKVRIYHLNPAGEETTVNILTRRQIIGEFAIIDGQPRSATASAINRCTLFEIGPEPFRRHLETASGLLMAMCEQVVRKARWTTMYAEIMARLDVPGRLLHLLLLYNDEFGREEVPDRRYTLDLGLNQTDLATLVGAQRGWINHILRDWRKRELIEYDAGAITILDLPRLRRERDSRLTPNHDQ